MHPERVVAIDSHPVSTAIGVPTSIVVTVTVSIARMFRLEASVLSEAPIVLCTMIVSHESRVLPSVAKHPVASPVVAMLDSIPYSVQFEGQAVLSRHPSHQGQEVERMIDGFTPTVQSSIDLARIVPVSSPSLRRGSAGQHADQQASQGDSLRQGPFCRMHWFILHA
jgi:hypothetical protein